MAPRGQKNPSYNVQTAVDSEAGLVLHHDVVTEALDNRQIHAVAAATKTSLEMETLTVVADRGYDTGEEVDACERDGITPCVPSNPPTATGGDGRRLFGTDRFWYDEAADCLLCPGGRRLVRQQIDRASSGSSTSLRTCSGCHLKPDCTTAERRQVKRSFFDDARRRANSRATPEHVDDQELSSAPALSVDAPRPPRLRL